MVQLSCFGDEIASDIETQIEVMTKNRIPCLELRTADGVPVLSLDDDHARIVKGKLDAAGIKVSAIGSPIGKIKISDPFEPHLEAFRRAIELAGLFGTQHIRLFSYFIPEGDDPAQYRDEVMARMSAKAEVAEEAGVLMMHENERDIYGDTAARCEDIVETVGSSALKHIIDPANFVMCGVKPFDDAYARYGAETTYFHIKDAVAATNEVVVAGDGDGQIAQILDALKKRDFSGILSLEPHLQMAGRSKGFTGPDLFAKAAAALRAIMNDVGLDEEPL
ncbi:MAG: sugar phosphate isomerase/epimerase [Candidatus Hydrogenedentes bacterium]|nr:sugar phosphate isomerase/epimerase [Candidatus Hydrogenedentota bacterium]